MPSAVAVGIEESKASLEAQAQAEPEDAFVNAFASKLASAGDFHKAVQTRFAVGIQQNVARSVTRRSRCVSARNTEMRCVRGVEGFDAELEFDAFRNPEFAEDAHVQIRRAGASQRVESDCSETNRRHRRERIRVIVRIARADAAQFLYIGFDLICALRIGRRIQRRAAGGNAERSAGEPAEQPVQLPAAGYSRRHSIAGQPFFAFAERQFITARDLHVVRTIKPDQRAIQVAVRRVLNEQSSVVVAAQIGQPDGF